MKRPTIILLVIWLAAAASAQGIMDFVERQMAAYPQSRLLDIYKSCFQDCMGAEHLVADTLSARRYLEQELAAAATDPRPVAYFEPCGTQGRHVRVNLCAVTDGLISSEALLDAFVRSANAASRPTVGLWSQQWHQMLDTIVEMQVRLPHFERDRRAIDSVLIVGHYAISHSPDYREAYHPHYRIVERTIFDSQLRPLLTRQPSAHHWGQFFLMHFSQLCNIRDGSF